MRALVVSDLHSNADALRAVMQRVRRKKYDVVICLGDFVGYGAQPNQVLDVMRTIRGRKLYIRGNHDRVAAGIEDGVGFNNVAKHAALWTRDHLSAPNRNFLKNLPLGETGVRRLEVLPRVVESREQLVFRHDPRLTLNTGRSVVATPTPMEKDPNGVSLAIPSSTPCTQPCPICSNPSNGRECSSAV